MAKRKHLPVQIEAWAIMDGDTPAVWDYRLPITWHKSTAENLAESHGWSKDSVCAVTITVTPKGRTR